MIGTTIRLFLAGLMAAALTAPALALQATSGQPGERVVQKGYLEIIAEGAPNDDLNLDQYRAFDRFAASHPQIIEELGRKPELLDSDKYLAKHPEFAQFLDAHPDLKSDFDANPGNYVPLEPNVEKLVELRSQRIELVSPAPTDERQSQR